MLQNSKTRVERLSTMKIKLLIMLLFINLLQARNECKSDMLICVDKVCISGTDESSVEKVEFTTITTTDRTYTIKHENLWMGAFKEYTILSHLQNKIQFLLLYEGNPYVGIIFELRKKDGKYSVSSLSEIDISKNIAHICSYAIKDDKDMIDFTLKNRKKNFIAKGCHEEKNFRLEEKHIPKVVKQRVRDKI